MMGMTTYEAGQLGKVLSHPSTEGLVWTGTEAAQQGSPPVDGQSRLWPPIVGVLV